MWEILHHDRNDLVGKETAGMQSELNGLPEKESEDRIQIP